jgi:DNA replication and repair protein RecF
VLLHDLELHGFRSYRDLQVTFAPGVTVLVGDNAQGKTNLLEAVGWLATLSSFRGATDDALVNLDADQAIVRANGTRDQRALLLEAEINRSGGNRTLVNRQPLRRTRDLLGALRVTVFAPDDLELVKQGPGLRRRFVDEALVAVNPARDALRTEVDRVLRQRNALLKQAKGRLSPDIEATLDVWDAKLADAGTVLAEARSALVAQLAPVLTEAYRSLAGGGRVATIHYDPPWRTTGLAAALEDARRDDVRRGVTTVGPHRDEVELTWSGNPARTHPSQGEQRTFALALRLASHRVVADATGSPPILLLDDVFSELDATRRAALLANLPRGQTLLTTAADVPEDTHPDLVLRVANGAVARNH